MDSTYKKKRKKRRSEYFKTKEKRILRFNPPLPGGQWGSRDLDGGRTSKVKKKAAKNHQACVKGGGGEHTTRIWQRLIGGSGVEKWGKNGGRTHKWKYLQEKPIFQGRPAGKQHELRGEVRTVRGGNLAHGQPPQWNNKTIKSRYTRVTSRQGRRNRAC